MKRQLRRGAALLIAVCMLLSMTGCVEKYYNGSQALRQMEDSEKAAVVSAVSKINQILTEGTLDDLQKQIPAKAENIDLSAGWKQWEEIREKYGELKSTKNIDIFFYGYAEAAAVNYEFEEITMTADMLFSSDHELVYLDFYESALSAEASYSLPQGLAEKKVTVGEGTQYPLEGVLTYPEGGTDLPAVVLVHGVGNNDKDETALSTKMFRDLANGLAQQGIAVLRYDKRGYTYPEAYTVTDLNTLTIDFQTIDDALLATELLRSESMVNPNRVFLIGHDLGALVAPRIDEQAGYAGYIMIASPSRPWSEAAYDQAINYGLNGMEYDSVQYLKPMLKSEIEEIRKVNELDEDKLSTPMLNQYAYFWKDLNAVDYAQMVVDADKPVMILQGSADYQIRADVDYKGWEEKLNGKEHAELKCYEGLNHMMMKPEGPYENVSKQYERPLHVAQEVVDDIGRWVLEQSR